MKAIEPISRENKGKERNHRVIATQELLFTTDDNSCVPTPFTHSDQ